jgi:hypothetical protein
VYFTLVTKIIVEVLLMRKIKYLGIVILSFYIVLFSLNNTYSKEKDNNKNKSSQTTLNKTTVDPSTSIININNISSIIVENGQQPPVLGGNSFNGELPIGSQLGAVYQEGVLWGGLVSDGSSPVVRVGGCTYDVGNVAITRLVRVRPDYQTADLTQDAAGFFQIAAVDVTPGQIDEVRAQYAKDWQEWPAHLGAPYDDVDGNGTYDPNVDIPGIPGASQTLFIGYDDSEALSLYASPVIGFEVYQTYWAYATSNPLGNVVFKKVKMIYTGTATSSADAHIDSMYIAQFCDADVGNYTDDYAGCVPDLDLGYAYSSAGFDQKYSSQGLVPPAVGYDFLQGASYFTGDPADSAIIDLKWRTGYKYFQEKPLSSYVYFAAGGSWSDPTLVSNSGNYDNGTLQMYNLLRGYLPSPEYPSAPLFPRPDEFGGPIGGFGTYLLDGDPATGQGWIDGIVETAGDRRILCINGPVSMEKNDTIEVVIALIGAQGVSNISSVSLLKYYDTFAQNAYNVLFDLPVMPQPSVQAKALDKAVVLNWGSNQNSIDLVENQPHGSYTFQAYAVYQLPTTTVDLSRGQRIAIYDVVDNVSVLREITLDEAAGETYVRPITPLNNIDGLKRYLTVTRDVLNNRDLINGQSYRFAVTAIAYNEELEPNHILESTPVIVDLTPHAPNPGTRYSGVAGDTLEVEHTSAGKASDGETIAIVVDPTAVNGHNYEVSFETTEEGEITWALSDVTAGNTLFSGQTNQSGDDTYLVVDGLMVKVVGPPLAINRWFATPNANRWITGVDAGFAQFFNGLDLGANFFGTDVGPTDYVPVEMRFTDNPTPSVENGWAQGAVYWRSDGYAYHGPGWMPFTTWDISDPDNPVQINVSFVEDANNGNTNLQWDLGGWDGSAYTDPETGGREYTFINKTPYDPNYYGDPAVLDGTYNDVLYAMWPTQRPGHPYLEHQFTFTIIPNYPNTPNDKFTFTAPAVTSSVDNAKVDVDKVNVFPNPYYGYQYRETSREGHYITFSHLPAQATIRIFDLAGVLVRTIEKNDASTQFQTWDLRNNDNYPVASGIYIAYIDMPELGKTKILKIAMIQEVQVLPVY